MLDHNTNHRIVNIYGAVGRWVSLFLLFMGVEGKADEGDCEE